MEKIAKRGFLALALVLFVGSAYLEAAGNSLPFSLFTSTGRTVQSVDTNGRTVLSHGSPTTAEGVNTGFVTGAAAKEFAVVFKNSQGVAVAMPDTRYAVYVSTEESTGLVGAASPTAIITKTAAGFYIQTDDNLTTNHTLRWWVHRY